MCAKGRLVEFNVKIPKNISNSTNNGNLPFFGRKVHLKVKDSGDK